MKNIKNIVSLFFFVSILLFSIGSVSGALECLETDILLEGHDYMQVNNTQYTLINHTGVDTKFKEFTSITPRLNFTIHVQQTINFTTGNQPDGTVQLDWYNASNIVLKNGSTIILNGADNWTYSSTTSAITLIKRAYENESLTIDYNRSFIKNVDDLVSPYYSSICTQCGSMYELNSTSLDYGENTGWKTRQSDLNNQNWATQFTLTNRTLCVNAFTVEEIDATPYINIIISLLIMVIIIGMLFTTVMKEDMWSDTAKYVAWIIGIVILIVIIGYLYAVLM